MAFHVQGMQDVVATVSGYHGSERFNLIKLISLTGASYVGAMSKSITHLVCWKFEGKKYSLAKKFTTIVVNHKWFEECIKQGKRVPEGPYVSKSGEDVGPLTIEAQLIAKGNGLTRKDSSSQKLAIHGDCEKENRKGDASDLDAWSESFLLKENGFTELGKTSGSTCKLKPRKAKRTLKCENQSSEYDYQYSSLAGQVGAKKHRALGSQSLRSTRDGSTILDISHSMKGTCLPESSRRRRRLVKKNADTAIVDLDSDQDDHVSLPSQLCEGEALPEQVVAGRGVNIQEIGETSVHQHGRHTGAANGASRDIDDIEKWKNLSQVPNFHALNVSIIAETASEGSGASVEKFQEIQESEAHDNIASVLPSVELSCVICWTEYSSTRGVLPCGHRFCYPCIQNWGDHMASQRKISTCPLCKASFLSITKVEDTESSDQKIYSQTIPCPSSSDNIFILTDQERLTVGPQSSPSVCSRCLSREPVELLTSCHLCNIRFIHSYCMDPYLLPWTCASCKDRRMLYHHSL